MSKLTKPITCFVKRWNTVLPAAHQTYAQSTSIYIYNALTENKPEHVYRNHGKVYANELSCLPTMKSTRIVSKQTSNATKLDTGS